MTTPNKEWLDSWQAVKHVLDCKVDLEQYFTEKQIGEVEVDVLNLGEVRFPTGEVIACDPLIDLGECQSFIQTIPPGKYPLKLCVELSFEKYACAKLEIAKERPVRYEMAMTGQENLSDVMEDEEGIFGFGVDAGMACLADVKAQEDFDRYWKKRLEKEEDIDNSYDDLLCSILEESAEKYPKYQREGGDWALWDIPDSPCNLPIYTSGWGDGYYASYFGYDKQEQICAVYTLFIDLEEEEEGYSDVESYEYDTEEERAEKIDNRESFWAHIAELSPEDMEELADAIRKMKKRLNIPDEADGKTIVTRLNEYMLPYIGRSKYPLLRYFGLFDFALKLSYLYGEAFRLAYGWRWVELGQEDDDERSLGLISPDDNFSLFPCNQTYKVLTGQYENNIIPLFELCSDLDEFESDYKYVMVAEIPE